MKSRITIDFQPDYKPVIKFNVDQKSDDVRDKLCRSLIEEAGDGHSSNLLFLKQVDSDHYTHCYEITSTTKQSREHILKSELLSLYRKHPGADEKINALFEELFLERHPQSEVCKAGSLTIGQTTITEEDFKKLK